MPSVVAGQPPQKSDAMWAALKAHIIRERQKKKQGKYLNIKFTS